MVRLKEIKPERHLYFHKRFQFQNGTIKRIWNDMYLAHLTEFQFQNGTIKS